MLTIALAAVVNILTRYLPFALFTRRDNQQPAPFIVQLGKFLPPAIMTMLVVYCYRGIDLFQGNHGLPELIAGLITAGLHWWQRQMVFSLLGGTLVYILLVNYVFNKKKKLL